MATTIDEYIAAAAPEARPALEKIRALVREAAPGAAEKISYRMPAFALDGDIVYFAAFKHHIGLYPPVRGDARLLKQLAPYAGEKGNLKFPLNQPMPYELIGKVIARRLKEHAEHVAARQAKPKRVR